MYLSKLKLDNFRNYSGETTLYFPNRINIFVGDNAQGKTNLLEAIYYLAFGNSFRSVSDPDLINFESNYFVIEGEVIRDFDEKRTIFFKFQKAKRQKEARINDIRCPSLSEAIGNLLVVIFSPEHLALIKGSPAIRRKYLDYQITQIQPKFYHYLRKYYGILSQRNSLLKQGNYDKELEIWDRQLSIIGSRIISARMRALQCLLPKITQLFKKISLTTAFFNVEYVSTVKNIEAVDEKLISNCFFKQLLMRREYEIRRGFTTIGPHRDDLYFELDNKPLKEFGSQGQHRMAVLALKFSELYFIREYTGVCPVLLLDDVMSELDVDRRRFVLDCLKNVQTLVTTTDTDYFLEGFLNNAEVWTVKNGTIE